MSVKVLTKVDIKSVCAHTGMYVCSVQVKQNSNGKRLKQRYQIHRYCACVCVCYDRSLVGLTFCCPLLMVFD